MSSSTAEQPKDGRSVFVNTAAALSTPELESAIEGLQEILTEREIQSYDLEGTMYSDLVGLDQTKIKLVSLKKPTREYERFVQEVGDVYPDKTKGWVFHIGSGTFEMQYVRQEKLISAGTDRAFRSVFAFGPALLSAGFPEHIACFANEKKSGFGNLVKRLNKDCGVVAPWKWDVNRAVQLVCWAAELIGETDADLDGAVYNILERADDYDIDVDEDESDEGEGDEDEDEDKDEDKDKDKDEDEDKDDEERAA